MTQKEQVLKHLQSGKSLSPLEALNYFGSLRLGAIIFDLKKDGYEIETEINQVGKHYAVYKMKRKDELF